LLRLSFEELGFRNVDLHTVPHVRVQGLERRHFLAGSTRIAHTWRDGLRREAERGHRSFVERQAVHRHLFVQLSRAGLGYIERIELHWGDAEVSTLLESETKAIDRDLKCVLLALEDERIRELLLDNEPFVVHGLVLEAWLDVAQRSRVLHVSFGRRRQRGRVRSFLSRMPSLAALVEGRQSAQPLADVEIVLIHHITSEVIGVISALRELGCRSLSTLFVAYAGEAPGSYLGPILDLPEEEFTGYALSRIPDSQRIESRYRLSREYSRIDELRELDLRVQEAPDFFAAMSTVARELFVRAAVRAKQSGRKLLILEDGGYLAPALHRALSDNASAEDFVGTAMPWLESGQQKLGALLQDRLLGSVEHTRNGHDRLAEVKAQGKLSFPSLSIAISDIKREDEASEVSTSILQAIESILHGSGRILSQRNALILGSRGAIGRRLVRELCQRSKRGSAQVSGLDLVADGSAEVHEAKSFDKLERQRWLDCDLLIGVTGTSVLDGSALESWLLEGTRPELWIASGSTKTVEFSDFAAWLSTLRSHDAPSIAGQRVRLSTHEILDPISGRLFGHRHRFELGEEGRVRELCFLAHLMPINFLYYGVPTEMIEQVLRALVQAGLGLVRDPAIPLGLHAVDHDVDADGRAL
jgi:hypothetical protein